MILFFKSSRNCIMDFFLKRWRRRRKNRRQKVNLYSTERTCFWNSVIQSVNSNQSLQLNSKETKSLNKSSPNLPYCGKTKSIQLPHFDYLFHEQNNLRKHILPLQILLLQNTSSPNELFQWPNHVYSGKPLQVLSWDRWLWDVRYFFDTKAYG